MRRGKLNKFAWKMVLFAGIFQVLTVVLDQTVIQKQDDLRSLTFKKSSDFEKRTILMSTNSRIITSFKSNDFLVFILSASELSREKKDFLYFSGLFDQTRLMEDIFTDGYIKSIFSEKKLKAADRSDELKIKEYNYVEYFKMMIDENHLMSDAVNENAKIDSEFWHVDGEIFMLDGKKLKISEVIQPTVEHNMYYLAQFNKILLKEIVKIEKEISNNSLKIYEINSSRQTFLLIGVCTQLISLFFLILLFRNLLIIPKKIKRGIAILKRKI